MTDVLPVLASNRASVLAEIPDGEGPRLYRAPSVKRGLSFKLTIDDSALPSITSPPARRLVYKKLKRLGEGGSGIVYLAEFNDQRVAVKEIFVDRSDPKYEYRMGKIREEMSALSTLSHPLILSYIDGEIAPGLVTIITQYQRRGSVLRYIDRHGPLPQELAKFITLQLLEALSYIHSRGVVHRDIKAANILITDTDDIQIADFGVAASNNLGKDHIQQTMMFNSHQLNGSFYWMAPELFLEDTYDARVDTWAVGCTVLEMITGTTPFYELYPTMYALYLRFSDESSPFEIPDTYKNANGEKVTLNPALHKFLQRIMEPNYRQRPTCREILDNLASYEWLRDDEDTGSVRKEGA